MTVVWGSKMIKVLFLKDEDLVPLNKTVYSGKGLDKQRSIKRLLP